MNWESFKESAKIWYTRGSQFFLFQNCVFYLLACVLARDAIGLRGYITFLYHCVSWGRH